MNKPGSWNLQPRIEKRFGGLAAFLGLLALLSFADSGLSGAISLTKYQVEAAFLFNFAKYVDWPATAFSSTNAPITIGVLGVDRFDDNLPHAVEGKTVNGRPFLIKHLSADDPLAGCQILFISDSEAARMSEILRRAGLLPILTVGEGEAFTASNGIINFALKDGEVRLEINLASASQSGLTISSKLLAVADVVKGRTN